MDKLDLLYGDKLIVNDKLIIKHPTLIEIKELGIEKYNTYTSLLSMRPMDIADILWFETKVWYTDVSQWQFSLNLFLQYEEYREGLKWFTGFDFKIEELDDNIYLYCDEHEIAINEHFQMQISDFIRNINFMPMKHDNIDNCGNRLTKIFKLEQQYKKRKRKKKQNVKIDLSSILSSLIWKGGKGSEVWNFPIYSVYDGYFRLNLIDNYDKTLTALYSGNIDTTKNKIDIEKINWSNIIKI